MSAGHVWVQWCLFTTRPRGSHATVLGALGSVGQDEEDGVWPLSPTPSSCGSRFQERGRVGEAPVRRWVPACKLPTQHLHRGEATPRLERETEPGTREMACKRTAQCHDLPHEVALSPRHEALGGLPVSNASPHPQNPALTSHLMTCFLLFPLRIPIIPEPCARKLCSEAEMSKVSRSGPVCDVAVRTTHGKHIH